MDSHTSGNLSQIEQSNQPLRRNETTPAKGIDISNSTGNLFSEKALEVQRTLQSSLTMSLRKEAEMKPKLHSPTSEILLQTMPKPNRENAKSTSRILNFSDDAVHHEANLSTLSSSEKTSLQESELAKPIFNSHFNNGPNICLSTQFPSSLSPIKPYSNDSENNEKSLLELSQLGKGFEDDPNTKKLMEFIQKLEKGELSNGTLAERMNQLSFLLKNSSLNCGSTSDTEEIELSLHLASTLRSKPEERISKEPSKQPSIKFPERNQMIPTRPQESKTASSKKVERSSKAATTQQVKSKIRSSSNLLQSSHSKSVHFSQANKQESKKQDPKTSLKHRKSKPTKIASENIIPSASVSLHVAKEPIEEKVIVKSPSKPIQEINALRNNLHAMMNMHKNSLDSSICTDPLLGGQDSKDEDTLGSSDTATLLKAQPCEMFNISPSNHNPAELTDGLTSELFAILKSGPSKQTTQSNRSSIDSTVATEIGILRDTLEKETYRRKHCEKQIQRLQRKVLEVQQELAVSHSTDRKKDLMIEQLDKTLAKVVGGWKVHEANLVKTIADYASEKEKNVQEMVKLKELVVSLENELAKVLEELVEEKEHVLRLEENEKAIQQQYKARAEEISHLIDQKNEQAHKQQKKMDELLTERKKQKHRIDDLSEELKIQGKNFAEKEAHWEEAVVDIEKRQKDLLEKEKSFTEQERKRCATVQSSLSSTEQEVSRLQSLLEVQRGEVESLHTQLDVLEAKQQSDIQKLEAEHKINVERQIMDKLAQVHEESQSNEARIRENHKKQMLDLIASHKRELESQCRRYENELQKRDEMMRQTIAEHETAMNDKLKLKSEEMRNQMLSKMQNLLQTHYNETLQVVGNTTSATPQRIPVSSNDVTLLQSRPSDESMMLPIASAKPTEAKSQQMNMSSLTLPQPSIIKPVPTMASSFQHKSAFSSTSLISPPSMTSSQPLVSRATSYQPISSPINEVGRHGNEFLSGYSVTDPIDAVETVPNLSLISSISHGQTTTVQPRAQQPLKSVGFSSESNRSTSKEQHIEGTYLMAGLQNNSFVSSNDSMSAKNLEEIRKTQLQHYVQLLLQRSPGDPVESSTADQSPTPERKIEDKENADVNRSVPASQNGAVLQQLLNQQNKVSPDVIPFKQTAEHNTAPVHKSLLQDRKKPSNLVDSKHGKQNVRFAQDAAKVAPVPSTVKPSMVSLNSGNFLSPLQVGEISQILGLYSTSATPTGETRFAAEQILRYLRDTNSANQSQSSIQPSSASSPVKRPKQHLKSNETLAASGGKPRSKLGNSPAKPNPVWR